MPDASISLNGVTLTAGGDNSTTAFAGTISVSTGGFDQGRHRDVHPLWRQHLYRGHYGFGRHTGDGRRRRHLEFLGDHRFLGCHLVLASFNQSVGSIAGAGDITLGSATLTVGGDNTSPTFSSASIWVTAR